MKQPAASTMAVPVSPQALENSDQSAHHCPAAVLTLPTSLKAVAASRFIIKPVIMVTHFMQAPAGVLARIMTLVLLSDVSTTKKYRSQSAPPVLIQSAFPFPFRVRGTGEDGNISLLSASWSRTIFEKASIFVTGYTDLDKRSNYGVFAGLSIPIGNNKNALVSADKDGIETSLTKSGILGEDPLSWSLRDRETRKGKGIRSASVKYHASVGDISGSVDQSGDDRRITATVDGALIIAGGGTFFVNQVDDAFAIVKGGGPNAPVSLNGRLITTTNSGGRAFIPDLQSYQENSLTIDPKNLPLGLQPDSTQSLVIPADRSGVVVDFGAKKLNAATVILTNSQGEPLPLGAEVKRDGTDQVAPVGYNGKVWLTDLAARNDLTITLPDGLGTCHASFTYKPVSGSLLEIAGSKIWVLSAMLRLISYQIQVHRQPVSWSLNVLRRLNIPAFSSALTFRLRAALQPIHKPMFSIRPVIRTPALPGR